MLVDYGAVTSLISVLYSVMTLVMLQKTPKLGDLISMFTKILNELNKFIMSCGLIIIAFTVVSYSLNTEFKVRQSGIWAIMLDIVDGISGNQQFSAYRYP